MQQYGQILHTLCPVKEARHKRVYTVWIYLCEALEEAMQIHGNRNWKVVVSSLFLGSGRIDWWQEGTILGDGKCSLLF